MAENLPCEPEGRVDIDVHPVGEKPDLGFVLVSGMRGNGALPGQKRDQTKPAGNRMEHGWNHRRAARGFQGSSAMR